MQTVLLQKREQEIQERADEEQRRKRMDREAEADRQREQGRVNEYREQCRVQFEENKLMKDRQKRLEEEEAARVVNSNDNMLGQLFVEKQHVSYKKRELNDRRVELIKDQMMGD